MLMVISPAKVLDETTEVPTIQHTQCAFIEQSAVLIYELQLMGPVEVGQLMHISEKLLELNYARFQAWKLPFPAEQVKQAAWLFKGDVYQGLDAYSLSKRGIGYIQTHLRILSGLYGLLKPCDDMLPYRLEMGIKFANQKGKDLYDFWGSQITDLLNVHLAKQGSNILVNLASNEYFKAVKKKELNGRIITPIFKDWKGGKYKIISFYAKRARGLMVRYAADNVIEDSEELKFFDIEGYKFDPEQSSEIDWVFIRQLED